MYNARDMQWSPSGWVVKSDIGAYSSVSGGEGEANCTITGGERWIQTLPGAKRSQCSVTSLCKPPIAIKNQENLNQ